MPLISSHLISSFPILLLKYIDVHRQTDRQTTTTNLEESSIDDSNGTLSEDWIGFNPFQIVMERPPKRPRTAALSWDGQIQVRTRNLALVFHVSRPPFLHHGLGHALSVGFGSQISSSLSSLWTVVADVLPFVTITCSLGYIFNVGTPRLLCASERWQEALRGWGLPWRAETKKRGSPRVWRVTSYAFEHGLRHAFSVGLGVQMTFREQHGMCSGRSLG